MRARAAWLLIATACASGGGAGVRPSGVPSSSVLLVAHGGVLVPLACAGASGAACLDRIPAGAQVRAVAGGERPAGARTISHCDEARPGLSGALLPDGIAVTPPAMPALPAGSAEASVDERRRITEQLSRTDPTSASVLVEVRGVVRADLDGDSKEDTAFSVRRGELDALLVASSSNPVRLRILQFADGEPIDLLGTVDVDPARPGRELVIRVHQGEVVVYEAVRDTGELIGRARCLTSS